MIYRHRFERALLMIAALTVLGTAWAPYAQAVSTIFGG